MEVTRVFAYAKEVFSRYQRYIQIIGFGLLAFLAFLNLDAYPLTWFDEGSYLHVPKALVLFGKYADYSSEGFRYSGPIVGVGPTVLLPIALVFRLFGISLMNARVIMVLYLLATIVVFFNLSQLLGGVKLAWVASLLLVSSRSVLLLEYGRQVLGEVPALFFLLFGTIIWFRSIKSRKNLAVILSGVLFGFAMITKSQFALFLLPAGLIVLFANWFYYKELPTKSIGFPFSISLLLFVIWQVSIQSLSGSTNPSEGMSGFRAVAESAFFIASPRLIESNIRELLSGQVFIGALLPAIVFGLGLVVEKSEDSIRWLFLWSMGIINLFVYVFASVGWKRYYFVGLALAALFVGMMILEIIGGSRWKIKLEKPTQLSKGDYKILALKSGFGVWTAAMIVLPLTKNIQNIVLPPFNAPAEMASYLNESITEDTEIETWEPELGFLTDHNYHYPPNALLARSNQHVWQGGQATYHFYDYVEMNPPEFIIIGHTGRLSKVYSPDFIENHYSRIEQIGEYQLFRLRQ